MDKQKLPTFPDFEKLDITHKELLQAVADQFDSYSDFNFVSLFTWDIDGSVLVSSLNDNLVIRFSDYLDNKIFYSFIGVNKINETVTILLEHARKTGEHADLLLIPETTAQLISNKNHEIAEDRDNHDYILSVDDLVEFRTNKYRGKKNLLNRFQRIHGPDSISREIDLTDHKNRMELVALLDDWQESRSKGDLEVDNEHRAIKRAMEHSHLLGIRAFGIYVKDKLIGFTIFELLNNKEAVIHYDKADVRYVGIFEHLKHNLAKHLANFDIKTINYEQDLGIAGLRTAKESYHPVKFLKKYTISLKNS